MKKGFYLRAGLVFLACILVTGLVVTQGLGVHNQGAGVNGQPQRPPLASAEMDWLVLALLLSGGVAMVFSRRKAWARKE